MFLDFYLPEYRMGIETTDSENLRFKRAHCRERGIKLISISPKSIRSVSDIEYKICLYFDKNIN